MKCYPGPIITPCYSTNGCSLVLSVPSLWRERNARIFRNVSLTPLAFFKLVDRSLRDRLLSITRDPSQALSLLQFYFWFLVLIANR
ncbi:hypothetical protein IGI04_010459 [Brassica rapa subsp. trilocularis]|uniref:Uncharacterized protein n=1 Tax=Brassica rapa subsp. trilocularis TaxID=1813537 RepID=A0ABQ7N096_BRACM|nr:hypothetical protein IGI04_010459 [Brassica rapa subsp. trilocularis]